VSVAVRTRPWISAAIFFLIGAYLTVEGAVLVIWHGSAYYLIAGVLMVTSAVLLLLRLREGAWLYLFLLLGTLVWSLWEVGLDGWALMPRLGLLFVLGLILLLRPVRRSLRSSTLAGRRFEALFRPAWLAAAALLAVGLGVGAHALRSARVDPLYQRGIARLEPAPIAGRPMNADSGDWPYYGRDLGGTRFSPLDQITKSNVSQLKVAWVYHTGPSPQAEKATLEVTPIKIGDSVFLCTSVNQVIALDAETGRERWRFDPHTDFQHARRGACRGVAYYRAPDVTGECAERIITATIDARLIALDARSGRSCKSFGTQGETSLLEGMGDVPKGYYYVSSAPTIVRGRVVVGGYVADGQYWGEPSGVIRAYDAVTGRFAWALDVGRPDRSTEPPSGESYTRSTPNSWGPMSGDENLGLIYAPTGNSVPDYYGAQRRPFDDRYSSSVLAIEAETGKIRWSFQAVHHDVWDYDVSSQPTLLDLPDGAGGVVPALLQATKRGEVFLLDRVTGVALASVEEKPAPQRGAAPGERLSPTQPFSTGMPSFRGSDLIESDMWGITPLDQLLCRLRFRRARYEGPLTPPGLTPNIQYPGYLGGMNWWGMSINPEQGIMVVNVNRVANYDFLIPRAEADRMGLRPLVDGGEGDVGGFVAQAGTPFAAGITPFMSRLGIPCQAPPYGVLSAVDLRTRRLLWTRRLGTAASSGPFNIPSHLPLPMGTPNLGGSFSTRTGLSFIAATPDRYLRAYDSVTGEIVWSDRLPAGAHATPMSYLSPGGRQMVVVAAAGLPPFGSKAGDFIIAYALPATP
jgi:quinoprotein glucose dehydrogenase